jgi:hypothetical protein
MHLDIHNDIYSRYLKYWQSMIPNLIPCFFPGGFSTIVASYLARARGSNEPELSIARVKDLEQFLRECEAFHMDHGHKVSHDQDDKIDGFRRRFEELLGNANG